MLFLHFLVLHKAKTQSRERSIHLRTVVFFFFFSNKCIINLKIIFSQKFLRKIWWLSLERNWNHSNFIMPLGLPNRQEVCWKSYCYKYWQFLQEENEISQEAEERSHMVESRDMESKRGTYPHRLEQGEAVCTTAWVGWPGTLWIFRFLWTQWLLCASRSSFSKYEAVSQLATIWLIMTLTSVKRKSFFSLVHWSLD